MHFHTSQNITFSHFSHRQRDDEVKESGNENDPQTVLNSSVPQERKQEPFARHLENIEINEKKQT